MNFTPKELRMLRDYSMARARDCAGSIRSLWVTMARRDNHQLLRLGRG